MSNLQLQSFGFETIDYSSEELDTFTRLVAENKDVLERKSQSIVDNLRIAAMLSEFKALHTSDSLLFKSFLDWLADKDLAWASRNFRATMSKAWKGYQALAGTEEEKHKMLSSIRSVSALGAILEINQDHLYEFSNEILKSKDVYTAQRISSWKKASKPKRQSTADYYKSDTPSATPAPPAEPESKTVSPSTPQLQEPVIDVTANTLKVVTDEVFTEDEIKRAKVDALVELLKDIDSEFVSFDKDCIDKLKPYRYQLEALVTAAERQFKPPTHYA